MKDEEIMPIGIIVICISLFLLNDYLSEMVQVLIFFGFIFIIMIRGIFKEYKEKRKFDKHHIIIYIFGFLNIIIILVVTWYEDVIKANDNYFYLFGIYIFMMIVTLFSVALHAAIKARDKRKIRFLLILASIMVILILLGILVITGILL